MNKKITSECYFKIWQVKTYFDWIFFYNVGQNNNKNF